MTEVQQENPAPDVPDVPDEGGAGGTATVGRQLRLAREAAGLTSSDVAQSLKFSQRQVEQLEADDYASLPGTTIVRGFTRSYARLLGLDAAILLQLLDARTPHAPIEVRPPDNMGIASAPRGLRQLSLLSSAAIVIALAAVLIGLWQYFSPKPAVPAAVAGKQTNGTAVVTAGDVTATAPAAPEPRQEAVAQEASPPVAVSDPMLVFSFEESSWVEVTDAAKQVLHSGESPAGTRLELSGQPPFDVVVGNASRVKVIYGGREIDLAPHTRAEVARLKIE